MDSFDQLKTDVFYLTVKKRDFAEAWSRLEAFAAEAKGLDAGRAMWLRGIVLREEGRLPEATASFQAAEAALVPDARLLSACLLDCAGLANMGGDLDAAEVAERKLLQLAQQLPEARYFKQIMYGNIGDTHYLRSDVAGAVEWYKKALRELEDPFAADIPSTQRTCTMALLWHRLVSCYLDLGDLVRARFALEGVRQCRLPIMQGMGAFDEFQIALHAGRLAEAESWLLEADRLTTVLPARQSVLLGYIWLAEAKGDAAAVRRRLEQLHAEHNLILYEIRMKLDKLHINEGVAS